MNMTQVVLTFDDGCRSHLKSVAPMLKDFGFSATFFVCSEFFGASLNGKQYLNGAEIIELHQHGFEIGNHMSRHLDLTKLDTDRYIRELDSDLYNLGLPNSKTFCYPGFHIDKSAKRIAKNYGFKYARSGCEDVLPFDQFQKGGKGKGVAPNDDKFALNCFAVFGSRYGVLDFRRDISDATGKYLILCFHDITNKGLTDVDMSVKDFEGVLKTIKEKNLRTVPFRDIEL